MMNHNNSSEPQRQEEIPNQHDVDKKDDEEMNTKNVYDDVEKDPENFKKDTESSTKHSNYEDVSVSGDIMLNQVKTEKDPATFNKNTTKSSTKQPDSNVTYAFADGRNGYASGGIVEEDGNMLNQKKTEDVKKITCFGVRIVLTGFQLALLFVGLLTIVGLSMFFIGRSVSIKRCENLDNPLMGDGICHAGLFGTCHHDLGDCKGLHKKYPKCPSLNSQNLIDDEGQPIVLGNGICNQNKRLLVTFMSEDCGWVFGDCLEEWNTLKSHCEEKGNIRTCYKDTMKLLTMYPNCKNTSLFRIADNVCDADSADSPYLSEDCGFDGNDCCTADKQVGGTGGYCRNYAPYNTAECSFDGGNCIAFNAKYPNCKAEETYHLGDGYDCYAPYNTEECGFDGGDCIELNDKYPNCKGFILFMGNGRCDNYATQNTEECGFDGGDCTKFNEEYPECTASEIEAIGDGMCHNFAPYNTAECGYDGGDCDDFYAEYPNCAASLPSTLGNGYCADSRDVVNIADCGFDGGDCLIFNEKYPNCKVASVGLIGNGVCNNEAPYNTAECDFDGGDCLEFNTKYPNCEFDDIGTRSVCVNDEKNTAECGFDGGTCIDFNTKYPNCPVRLTDRLGDKRCNNRQDYFYNTAECGFDGGDCVAFNAKYPDCKVEFADQVGDGQCNNHGLFNTAECGFDGGDCIRFNIWFPNCSARNAYRIGDGNCDDAAPYNTFACGFDGGDCT